MNGAFSMGRKHRNLPSLKALQAFEAAARWGSVSLAAQEMNVTHAAISRHVRLLETYLGFELFDRSGRKFTLTPRGSKLYFELRESFDRILGAIYGQMEEHHISRLTVSVDPDFAELWLIPRLSVFSSYCPELGLEITLSRSFIDFAEGRVDAAIYYGKEGLSGAHTDVLRSLKAFPVCHPQLLEGPDALRQVSDLRSLTLLHERSTDWWKSWLDAVGDRSVDWRRGNILPTTSLCLSAAIHTRGVAIGDDFLAARYLAEGALCRPFDFSLPSPESYNLVIPKPHLRRPDIACFRHWLLHECAR